MIIKIGDKFLLHSSDGLKYTIVIVNINDFRPPDMIYACNVFNEKGYLCNQDLMFIGDDFFSINKEKLEKL